jgi:hypothetical protein
MAVSSSSKPAQVLLDETGSDVSWVVNFDPPRFARGAPGTKACLSGDGQRVYVLGSHGMGGLSSIEVPSGQVVTSYSDGAAYAGVSLLASGNLLGVGAPDNPRLDVFDQNLNLLQRSVPDLLVTSVF